MKKMLLMISVLVFGAMHVDAETWFGLTDDNWYSGPKLTEDDLAGKVVVVFEWGIDAEGSVAMLPRAESIWQSFKSKPFMIIGSHRAGRAKDKIAELLKKHKVTFPIYERAGLQDGEPKNSNGEYPFFYVVNHRGKVVYPFAESGQNSDRDATQALAEAIMKVGAPLELFGDVELKKYRSLQKQLVLGKNAEKVVKQLEKDIKKSKNQDQIDEAQELMTAIGEAKLEIAKDIEAAESRNPAEAIKLMKLYIKTWPKDSDSETYKAKIPELTKAVAEAKKKPKAKK